MGKTIPPKILELLGSYFSKITDYQYLGEVEKGIHEISYQTTKGKPAHLFFYEKYWNIDPSTIPEGKARKPRKEKKTREPREDEDDEEEGGFSSSSPQVQKKKRSLSSDDPEIIALLDENCARVIQYFAQNVNKGIALYDIAFARLLIQHAMIHPEEREYATKIARRLFNKFSHKLPAKASSSPSPVKKQKKKVKKIKKTDDFQSWLKELAGSDNEDEEEDF